jgi:hypothetical protein
MKAKDICELSQEFYASTANALSHVVDCPSEISISCQGALSHLPKCNTSGAIHG